MNELGGFISTNSETFNKYYKKKYGYKFQKAKIYKFDYKYKERFYELGFTIAQHRSLILVQYAPGCAIAHFREIELAVTEMLDPVVT